MWARMPTRQPARTPALLLLLKRKVGSLVLFARDRDLDLLCSQLFVHGSNCVCAWRQPLNVEVAVAVADRKKRVADHVHIHLHPRMLVAGDGQQQLWVCECPLLGLALGHLALIPLRIVLRNRMHIVHGVVAVENSQSLPSNQAKHVRSIAASYL